MDPSKLTGDYEFAGNCTFRTLTLPLAGIENRNIKTNALDPIAAEKVEQQYTHYHRQADGTDVAAATEVLHLFEHAGEIVDMRVICLDAPSGGGTEEISVDLAIANQSTPTPASILTAPATIDDSVADCEVVVASLAASTAAAGDALVLSVAVSGSGGAQGQGLAVRVTVREFP